MHSVVHLIPIAGIAAVPIALALILKFSMMDIVPITTPTHSTVEVLAADAELEKLVKMAVVLVLGNQIVAM